MKLPITTSKSMEKLEKDTLYILGDLGSKLHNLYDWDKDLFPTYYELIEELKISNLGSKPKEYKNRELNRIYICFYTFLNKLIKKLKDIKQLEPKGFINPDIIELARHFSELYKENINNPPERYNILDSMMVNFEKHFNAKFSYTELSKDDIRQISTNIYEKGFNIDLESYIKSMDKESYLNAKPVNILKKEHIAKVEKPKPKPKIDLTTFYALVDIFELEDTKKYLNDNDLDFILENKQIILFSFTAQARLVIKGTGIFAENLNEMVSKLSTSSFRYISESKKLSIILTKEGFKPEQKLTILNILKQQKEEK